MRSMTVLAAAGSLACVLAGCGGGRGMPAMSPEGGGVSTESAKSGPAPAGYAPQPGYPAPLASAPAPATESAPSRVRRCARRHVVGAAARARRAARPRHRVGRVARVAHPRGRLLPRRARPALRRRGPLLQRLARRAGARRVPRRPALPRHPGGGRRHHRVDPQRVRRAAGGDARGRPHVRHRSGGRALHDPHREPHAPQLRGGGDRRRSRRDERPPGTFANRGYVIGAWDTLDIDGFRQSQDEVAAFRFAKVRDSYAAQTGDARNVGVIGVAFFAQRGDDWNVRELQTRDTREPLPPREPFRDSPAMTRACDRAAAAGILRSQLRRPRLQSTIPQSRRLILRSRFAILRSQPTRRGAGSTAPRTRDRAARQCAASASSSPLSCSLPAEAVPRRPRRRQGPRPILRPAPRPRAAPRPRGRRLPPPAARRRARGVRRPWSRSASPSWRAA